MYPLPVLLCVLLGLVGAPPTPAFRKSPGSSGTVYNRVQSLYNLPGVSRGPNVLSANSRPPPGLSHHPGLSRGPVKTLLRPFFIKKPVKISHRPPTVNVGNKENPSGFMAFATRQGPASRGSVFNHIFFDHDGSYDASTGVFKPKFAGMYVFFVSVTSSSPSRSAIVEMKVDGKTYTTVRGSHTATGSGQLLVYLKPGASVQAVMAHWEGRKFVELGTESSFAGYLVARF